MSDTNGQVMPVSPMQEQVVCLLTQFHELPNRRKVDAQHIQTDADLTMVTMTKQLIDSPELRELRNLTIQVRDWLRAEAVPSHLKRGLWLIHVNKIDRVEQRLQAYEALFHAQVNAIIAAYPQRCLEAVERLGSLYDTVDYIQVCDADGVEREGWQDDIREQCTFEWRYVEITIPHRLQTISTALFEREKQKTAAYWEEVRDSVRQLIFAELLERVEEFRVKLVGHDGDGATRRLQQRYIDQCNQFVQSILEGRDITNSPDIRDVTERIQKLLRGLSLDDLRSQEGLRTVMHDKLVDIRQELEKHTEVKPTRTYTRRKGSPDQSNPTDDMPGLVATDA